LAYIRYGDDFLIFASSQSETESFRNSASAWLGEMLKLAVHPKNDVVFQAKHGAHFLGHRIYPNGSVIDRTMQHKIDDRLNQVNVSSYSAMKLPRAQRKRLPWRLL
jgi:hypothetical protein